MINNQIDVKLEKGMLEDWLLSDQNDLQFYCLYACTYISLRLDRILGNSLNSLTFITYFAMEVHNILFEDFLKVSKEIKP